jgi:hypothetical protein
VKAITLALLFATGAAFAHGGDGQMSAAEMQINAVERWSRMVTQDQRQKSAQALKQQLDAQQQVQQQAQSRGAQAGAYTGEGATPQ